MRSIGIDYSGGCALADYARRIRLNLNATILSRAFRAHTLVIAAARELTRGVPLCSRHTTYVVSATEEFKQHRKKSQICIYS